MAGERYDQPFAFGIGDKQIGWNAPLGGMLPADQCLKAGDGVGCGVEHRLIFNKDLIVFDASQQGAFGALAQYLHIVIQRAHHQGEHQAAQYGKADIISRQGLVIEDHTQWIAWNG
ncbi:hypothetical protein D3C77_624190 [compost metagenome]